MVKKSKPKTNRAKPRFKAAIDYDIKIFSTILTTNIVEKKGLDIDLNYLKEKILSIREDLFPKTNLQQQCNLICELGEFAKEYKSRNKDSIKTKIILDSNELKKIISKNASMIFTLKEIKHEYCKLHPSDKFSISTLRRHLITKMGYRYMINNLVNVKNSTELSKKMNLIYLRKLVHTLLDEYMMIYIDESSFNDHALRKYSWRNKEQPLRLTNNGRIESISFIGAISKDDKILFDYNENTNTSETFAKFLDDLEKSITQIDKYKEKYLNKRIILVMDNAKIHTSKKTRKKLDDLKFKVFYLPPYSPKLNCIEYVWGWIKRKMRRRIIREK